MNDALRRSLLSMSVVCLLTLNSCGGGGSSIPPFWSQFGMVLGDFNGDGRLDVARAITYISGPPPHSGYVEVFLQTPTGHFDAPTQYSVGPDPWNLATGDMDVDGHLDIVAVTPRNGPAQINTIGDSGEVSILRHDSAHPGQFLASNWIATGGSPESAAIADLNADGAGDLLVADAITVNGRALLYLQDRVHPGTLLPPTSLQTGGGSVAVVLKDLNSDGLNDIILNDGPSVLLQRVSALGTFDAVRILR